MCKDLNEEKTKEAEKFIRLENQIKEWAEEDICIAFSGGIDSSLLLKLGAKWTKKHNKICYGVIFVTPLQPRTDLPIAKRVCKECGAEFVILEFQETENEEIWNNPIDRCYLCKKYLFEKLKVWAASRQINCILEGSNEDDKKVYRPGIRAVEELEIKSPLMEFHFTKREVRKLAGQLGISVTNRPSQPCMATRIPYHTKLDMETLKRLEEGETYLRELGFSIVRARLHDKILRIEISKEQMADFLSKRDEIVNKMKQLGFLYITLDLEGFRSGSMDEGALIAR
ncbi:MAG: ATP-dependent sacrificial sulfur transferase LarE [Acetivibrio sp.]